MYVEYDVEAASRVRFGQLEGAGLWRYAQLLPIETPTTSSRSAKAKRR